ncbi:MAG: hypothetical protein V3T86_07660 [Planctomycetota bacterium]
MQIDIEGIPGAIASEEGLPQLCVDPVVAWLVEHVPDAEQDAAWRFGVVQWVGLLSQALGEPYRVLESDRVVLLSAESDRQAGLLLHTATESFRRVARFLGSSALTDWATVLAFDRQDRYYDYISAFYPDGEFPASAGCCVSQGLPHVVIAPCSDLLQLETIAAHELSHTLVYAFDLPVWLNEGLAVVTESGLSEYYSEPQELRACWQEFGLDTFWTGESFNVLDDRGRLSYDLAYLLVRALLAHDQGAFASLLQNADPKDGGFAACRNAYGVDPGTLAQRFLSE